MARMGGLICAGSVEMTILLVAVAMDGITVTVEIEIAGTVPVDS